MSESIKEMEGKWLVLMAAKDARTGQRIYDNDPKYRRDVFALRTQIEERKTVEALQARISPEQIRQLEWLDRAAAATDKTGKRLTESTNISGSPVAANLIKSRALILDGGTLSAEFIANSERLFAEAGVTMPPENAPAVEREATPMGPPVQATVTSFSGLK